MMVISFVYTPTKSHAKRMVQKKGLHSKCSRTFESLVSLWSVFEFYFASKNKIKEKIERFRLRFGYFWPDTEVI